MNLLVGAPVARRQWVIHAYLDHLEAALAYAEIDAELVFVAAPLDPTVDAIIEHTDRKIHWVWHEEGPDGRTWDEEAGRTWNTRRYEYMVVLRNLLLARVRSLQPDRFLSLDTDVLLHEKTIAQLLKGTTQFDVVGGRCYMTTTGRQFPSQAMFNGSQLRRHDLDYGPTPTDCVMAIKMMTPKAYSIDYQVDVQGEDAGWCRNCKANDVTIAYDGTYANKHVMTEQWLDKVDNRVGF